MQTLLFFDKPIYFISQAAVGGLEEGRGAIGKKFDFIDERDAFGMKSFERAEGEMSRIALSFALKRAGLSHERLNLVVAGDLQNQCVASSGGLFSFGAPFLGLYGACSTLTESLIVLSSYLSTLGKGIGAAVTSSHNCAAERQFRNPLEYGGQRAPASQWTATASGAFVLSCERWGDRPFAALSAIMPGRIIDGYTTDKANMGAAMALSASDTLLSFFESGSISPDSYDLILTGDLGRVGSSILCELLTKRGGAVGEKIAKRHNDAGLLLYDFKTQDVHAGGSGCGCSASVLAADILPRVVSGEIKRMLLLSTGALMSTSSVNQGEHIYGITPLVEIKHID